MSAAPQMRGRRAEDGAPLLERFMMHVAVAGRGECWTWTGARSSGYGTLCCGPRTRKAHRVAYELLRGPIPPGLCVLHRCDNPPCVNPNHLFLGTQIDNIRDRMAKGRTRIVPCPGEMNGTSKLTAEQVRTIRSSSAGTRELAATYGVSQSLISMIRRRRIWKHVT